MTASASRELGFLRAVCENAESSRRTGTNRERLSRQEAGLIWLAMTIFGHATKRRGCERGSVPRTSTACRGPRNHLVPASPRLNHGAYPNPPISWFRSRASCSGRSSTKRTSAFPRSIRVPMKQLAPRMAKPYSVSSNLSLE